MNESGARQLAQRPLLTVNEVAERLAVTPATIRKRILERRIDFVKIGRCVRIPESAVEKLLKAGYSEAVFTK